MNSGWVSAVCMREESGSILSISSPHHKRENIKFKSQNRHQHTSDESQLVSLLRFNTEPVDPS